MWVGGGVCMGEGLGSVVGGKGKGGTYLGTYLIHR